MNEEIKVIDFTKFTDLKIVTVDTTHAISNYTSAGYKLIQVGLERNIDESGIFSDAFRCLIGKE